MLLSLLEKAIIKIFNYGSEFIYRLRKRLRRKTAVSQGLLLGKAADPLHPKRLETVSLDPEQRLKHLYFLGGTGSGKTKGTESLIRQDIKQGNGFTVVDPHGDLIESILRFLASLIIEAKKAGNQALIDSIIQRLILVEPFNREWSVGFNPLECFDKAFSYSQALELLGIFRRTWGADAWGPRMDEVLRNALTTLIENNLTLLEARPLLTDAVFRLTLLQNLDHAETKDYWLHRFNNLSEKMRVAYTEPVLNKITIFTADPNIRSMLGQRYSSLDFRKAMDEGNWVLLNLSKGHLKENASLLGSLFIAKLKLAAISRADIKEELRRPHTLYVDEFQNFVGDDFEVILSEARKYRLSLVIAHQTLAQLTVPLRSAIFGNVGAQVFFRVSGHDAATIAAELGHKDKSIEKRLLDLKVREAYLKVKGKKPVLLQTLYVPPATVDESAVADLKLRAYEAHAQRREQLEEEIIARTKTLVSTTPSSAKAGNVDGEKQRKSKTQRQQHTSRESAAADGTDAEEGQSSW